MKILIGLGHPAHYHLFKSFIHYCENHSYQYKVAILNKDVLEDLLLRENIPYSKIIEKQQTKHLGQKYKELIFANKEFERIVDYFKPTLLIGCINQIASIGWKKKIPSIFFAEDDFRVTFLQGLLIYPFISKIITPISTSVGPFKWKQITYPSFHELAYLHPNHFKPDKTKISHLFKNGKPYYILRFSNLTAYHDINVGGISNELATKIIDILSVSGTVYITSERKLSPEFESYRIDINSTDMHHASYYANIFVGDSQTMTAEAAILGTPALRFNNLVGRLGYLNELEYEYNLTFGFKPNQADAFISKLLELLSMGKLKEEWNQRRNILLNQKIDLAEFMKTFLTSYPQKRF